ncbi:MAG: hypothetical protein KC457_20010, partial [Myxococcales bacterium]|nr:hypothetical protein [Myxococcales bacterium]
HLSHDRIDEILELRWHRGYIVEAKVHVSEEEWTGPEPAQLLADLLACPSALFLRALWVGCTWNDDEWMGVMDRNLAAVAAAGPLEHLRKLTIADPEHYWDISSTVVGDVSAAIQAAPRLRELEAVGGEIWISDLTHEHLEVLTLRTGGLPGESALALGQSLLPALRRMTVYFGADNYGGTASIDDLAGILTGEGFPALEHLGLVDAEFQNEIAALVASSQILPQLRSLDLSLGTLTDAGAEAIAAAAPRFAHLQRLDLRKSFLTPAGSALLRQALPNVEIIDAEQRTPSTWSGTPHYYVSVAE